MQVTSITQKGQVTVPVDIRRFLKIRRGDQVVFLREKNKVILEPARNFLELKGTVAKGGKAFHDRKVDESILKYSAYNYGKKAVGS